MSRRVDPPRNASGLPGSASWRERVWSSHDYWAVARQLFPAARAGDPDAQYFLWTVLERCDEEKRFYLLRRGRQLTLDEALEWARARGMRSDMVVAVYERCHEFLNHPDLEFGAAGSWLAQAAAVGQSAAQSTLAGKLLMQEYLLAAAQPGAIKLFGGPFASNEPPDELLAAAVRSRDPIALWNVGELQHLLNPTLSDAENQNKMLAWQLVACRRGYDCGPNAQWVVNACYLADMVCPGRTGEELIQNQAGQRLAAVEQVAYDISDKLDAGDWQGLGFATP
jgi:hypothetical protein